MISNSCRPKKRICPDNSYPLEQVRAYTRGARNCLQEKVRSGLGPDATVLHRELRERFQFEARISTVILRPGWSPRPLLSAKTRRKNTGDAAQPSPCARTSTQAAYLHRFAASPAGGSGVRCRRVALQPKTYSPGRSGA